MYSIGSSMEMITPERLALISSTMAARVVVFPEPVIPVTKTNPCSSAQSRLTMGGRPRVSIEGMVSGMCRKVASTAPRL